MLKYSNFKKEEVETSTYDKQPPLYKEAITDFIDQFEKEEGDIVYRVEKSIDRVAEHHGINTQSLYKYVNDQVDELLGY